MKVERGARDLSKVFKQAVTKFDPAKEDRSFVFVASDGTVDRMGDTIAPEGWQLDRYRSNPVVLFAHDQRSAPIGKSLAEWVEGGQLKQKIQFTSEDENPDGYRTMKLIQGGYLRAVSVGFHPVESKIAEDRDDGQSWFPPMDFTKQELLETSVVPVPANPNALLSARAAGIEVDFIAAWAERVLSESKGAGLWVPRDMIERTACALAPARIFVDMAPKTAPAPAPAPVVVEPPKDTRDLWKQVIAEEVAKRRAARTGKLS